MAEHKRRRQNAGIETQEEQLHPAAPQMDVFADGQPEQEAQPAAPRRRRRAQPPQQITQRMKKISVPEDAQIPQLPVIEESEVKPAKKRYKKAAKKPKDTDAAQMHKEKAAQQMKAAADVSLKSLKTAGGVLLVILMALMEGGQKIGALAMHLAGRIKDLLAQRIGRETAGQEEVVLEAIRPQDYHGRGAQHVNAQAKQPKKAAALSWMTVGKFFFIPMGVQLIIGALMFININ